MQSRDQFAPTTRHVNKEHALLQGREDILQAQEIRSRILPTNTDAKWYSKELRLRYDNDNAKSKPNAKEGAEIFMA